MRRNEVLEHRHSLFEVRQNRVLDNLLSFGTGFLGLCHQTTHTRELLDLVLRTTGTRVEHHVYGVEALVGLGHLLEQNVAQVVVDVSPSIDNLVVALVVGDETHIIVVLDFVDLSLSLLNDVVLFLRDDDVVEVERQSCNISHAITEVLDTVEELAGASHTNGLDNVSNDAAEGLLRNDVIEETNLVGHDAVDNHATYRRFDSAANGLAFNDVVDNHLHRSMKVALAFIVGYDGLFRTVEYLSLALGSRAQLGDIVETKHHIL